MNHYDYHRPGSLQEVWELIEKIPGARIVAGATDLMVRIKNREIRPPALISLRNIPELAGVDDGKVTCIGAMTTITDLIRHPVLREKYPLLVKAAGRLGSVQIRNAATIGGNLCNGSPCADTAPPLLVMEARIRLRSKRGRREVPIRKFFKGPGETCVAAGEIMTHILLGPPHEHATSIFFKKGRVKMDLAVASVAALLETDGETCTRARLAAGSVAPVPVRLEEVEKLLEGAAFSERLAEQAGQAAMKSISPITDVRAGEEYRRHIIGVYVKRAVKEAFGRSEA